MPTRAQHTEQLQAHNARLRVSRHVIEAIRFLPGVPSDEAPTTCVCGWTGRGGEWMDHRGHTNGVGQSKGRSTPLGEG